jgi:hypothetical protein
MVDGFLALAYRDLKRELIRGFVEGNSAPAGFPRPPGQPGGFFVAGFRPFADTRSISRQKIADGHPRSVGSIKNQRIS